MKELDWLHTDTLEPYKAKLKKLKEKNAGKVKAGRRGKISELVRHSKIHYQTLENDLAIF